MHHLDTNVRVPSLSGSPKNAKLPPQSLRHRVNVSIFPCFIVSEATIYAHHRRLLVWSRHLVGVMIDVFQLSHMTLNTLPNI